MAYRVHYRFRAETQWRSIPIAAPQARLPDILTAVRAAHGGLPGVALVADSADTVHAGTRLVLLRRPAPAHGVTAQKAAFTLHRLADGRYVRVFPR